MMEQMCHLAKLQQRFEALEKKNKHLLADQEKQKDTCKQLERRNQDLEQDNTSQARRLKDLEKDTKDSAYMKDTLRKQVKSKEGEIKSLQDRLEEAARKGKRRGSPDRDCSHRDSGSDSSPGKRMRELPDGQVRGQDLPKREPGSRPGSGNVASTKGKQAVMFGDTAPSDVLVAENCRLEADMKKIKEQHQQAIDGHTTVGTMVTQLKKLLNECLEQGKTADHAAATASQLVQTDDRRIVDKKHGEEIRRLQKVAADHEATAKRYKKKLGEESKRLKDAEARERQLLKGDLQGQRRRNQGRSNSATSATSATSAAGAGAESIIDVSSDSDS